MNLPHLIKKLTASSESASGLNRRTFLRNAGATAALAPVTGLLLSESPAHAVVHLDFDIGLLNFALTLEYLEAEYYLYGTTGMGLEAAGIGVDGTGTAGSTIVKSDPKLHFETPFFREYAEELAMDESSHVVFLRTALGSSAVARPEIDLKSSFDTLAQAAGIADSFDPFANEFNFMLGGFIFEDVGATAYHGAVPLLTNKSYLNAVAGILGVESYHAGLLRTILVEADHYNPDLGLVHSAELISNLRDSLNPGVNKDQGLIRYNRANIVPTDHNGLIFGRTATEVLSILYGKHNATSGLFFPNGINGD